MDKKSKRNFSDIESHYSNSIPLYEHIPQKNAIKINRNKLPSDFFPRSQSSNQKKILRRNTYKEQITRQYSHRKPQQQHDNFNPQKTSFFGLVDENHREKKLLQLKIEKRKFQTRQQAKRDAIMSLNSRNLTPITQSQKSDYLELYPSNNDEHQIDEIIIMNKSKIISSQRSPNQMKFLTKINDINGEKFDLNTGSTVHKTHHYRKDLQLTLRLSDPNNITFFNTNKLNNKGISFPPVNSKSLIKS